VTEDERVMAELEERATSALVKADVARTHSLWATVGNAVVCLALWARLLPTPLVWASLVVWSWYAARAIVVQHEAGKAADLYMAESLRRYPFKGRRPE
jgi:hypothetical protein